MIDLILYLIAAICLALVAFGVTSPRVNILALGLFFFVLTFALHAAGVT